MSDVERRQQNVAKLKSVFNKMSTGRSVETISDITDDFEFELPYGPDRQPVKVKGKEPWKQMNEMTWGAFKQFGLEITKVHDMLNPDEVILEYRSEGEVAHTGKPYLNRYIGYFRFNKGLICEWREFHNPDVVSEAMNL